MSNPKKFLPEFSNKNVFGTELFLSLKFMYYDIEKIDLKYYF